jgi:hypothetical protein
MSKWNGKTMDKETFFRIMKNISPSSYILCAKCRTTKIDTPELLKFIEKFIAQYDSNGYNDLTYDELSAKGYDILKVEQNDCVYYELSEIMDEILKFEPDAPDQRRLSKWRLENKKRLFGQDEEGRLQYLVYDSIVFYQNIECGCYLKKSIDQKSVYSVRVE